MAIRGQRLYPIKVGFHKLRLWVFYRILDVPGYANKFGR